MTEIDKAFEQYASDAQDAIRQFLSAEELEGREDDIIEWIAGHFEEGSMDADAAAEAIVERIG